MEINFELVAFSIKSQFGTMLYSVCNQKLNLKLSPTTVWAVFIRLKWNTQTNAGVEVNENVRHNQYGDEARAPVQLIPRHRR